MSGVDKDDWRPPDEYGDWTRGNVGQVGRTVTRWVPSPLGWMPVVDWEPHPDEATRDETLGANLMGYGGKWGVGRYTYWGAKQPKGRHRWQWTARLHAWWLRVGGADTWMDHG